MTEVRTLEPPTTETKQLLVALEPDGYAAGRVGVSVLSLFFCPIQFVQRSLTGECPECA